jgi:hypothetical protein
LRKVLYLLKNPLPSAETILSRQRVSDQSISVVLLQEAVGQRDVPADRVYVLSDDAVTRQIESVYPGISTSARVRQDISLNAVTGLLDSDLEVIARLEVKPELRRRAEVSSKP